MNFSVCLISKNESKTLPRLLSSLKEFQERGGEVILVDTGSTDNTAQVARDLGCRVEEVGDKFISVITKEEVDEINAQFCDPQDPSILKEGDRIFDYASARNFAAKLSSTDMIAMPDCDEVYTKLDLEKVVAACEEFDQLEYNFVFSHDNEGKELVKFTHCKFYNRTKLKWVGVIHEVLQEIDGPVKKVTLGEEVIKLEHFQNVETDRRHYLKGLAYDVYHNLDNDRNSHYFARELFYRGMYKSALMEFQRHIDMNRWPTERSESMRYMAKCYQCLGKRDEAIGWYVRAYDTEPLRREPLIDLAEIYYKEKKPAQAAVYAQGALLVPGTDFYANYQPYYEHVPHEILYWAFWQMGDLNTAVQHFDAAMSYQPYNSKYLYDMRFFKKLPKIIIVPSETATAELLSSLEHLVYPQEKIEVKYLEGASFNEKAKEWAADGSWILYTDSRTIFQNYSLIIAVKTMVDNKAGVGVLGEQEQSTPVLFRDTVLSQLQPILDPDLSVSESLDLLEEKVTLARMGLRIMRAETRSPVKGIRLSKEIKDKKLSEFMQGIAEAMKK